MVSKSSLEDNVVCVVGLGYVGLPLAINFSKHFKTIGFDIDKEKVTFLKKIHKNFEITSNPAKIKEADFVISAVPTPLTKNKDPDLSLVISSAEIIAKNLKKGAIVVFESTVYPGVTEEIVAPILEKESKMKIGKDFKIGYSPERVNPGDDEHVIEKITKIVSGMDKESTEILSKLYGKITKTYIAENIKTAEAAKVIENVPDTRETPVRTLIKELKGYGVKVYGFDPILESIYIKNEFKIDTFSDFNEIKNIDAIVLAVSHDVFKGITLKKLGEISNKKPVLVDVSNFFDKKEAIKNGFIYRSL